jgi:hypothetical protein
MDNVVKVIEVAAQVFATLITGVALNLWSWDDLYRLMLRILNPFVTLWREASMVADLTSMHIELRWLDA